MYQDAVSQFLESGLFDVEFMNAADLQRNCAVQFNLLGRKSLFYRSLSLLSLGVCILTWTIGETG